MAWNDYAISLAEELGITAPSPVKVLFRKREKGDKAAGFENTSAFAVPAERNITVLVPVKLGLSPFNSLDNLVYHEIGHVLLNDLAGPDIPIWLDEGMVQYLGQNYSDNNMFRFMLLLRKKSGLLEMSRSEFYSDAMSYQLAHAFIAYLAAKYGKRRILNYIRSLRSAEDWRRSFGLMFGNDISGEYSLFYDRLRADVNILSLIDMNALFVLGALLLIISYIFYRIRRKRILKRMEQEDG